MEWTWTKIKNVLPAVIFSSMMVGWGARLLNFIYSSSLGYWHYFPIFPNVIDSLFMFVIALYIIWGKIRGVRKSNELYK